MSLKLNKTPLVGFSDETAGTDITAVPTTLSVAGKETYRFEVDTSGGAISFDAIALAGAVDGQTFEFVKTTADANAMTFTDAGIVYSFDLQGEILSLRFDGTNYFIGA